MPDIELPYVVDEALTGLSIAYMPKGFIADKILTKTPVSSPDFKYRFYEKGLFLTNIDTEIGEYGEPKETEFAYKEKSLSTSIYSHTTMLSLRHLNAPTSEKNKEAKRVMMSKSVLLLADEVRLAKMLRDKNAYAGNVLELTNEDNFSNADTTVIGTIEDCMTKMFRRPNKVVMSSKTLSKLRTCPQIIAAAKGCGELKDGKVSLDYLKKEVFDIEDILISDVRVNQNKRGQDVDLGYVWGNDIIFAYVDDAADIDCGLTFGQTAVYQDYTTQTYFKADRGANGVKYYKTGDEHKHFITSPDCGFIIKNAFNFA